MDIYFIKKQFPIDEELLEKVKQGDDEAKNILLEKYNMFSWKLVSACLEENDDYLYLKEEIHSDVFSNTFQLIEKYSLDKGKFYSYWLKASLRTIYKDLREIKERHYYEKSYISLDEAFLSKNILHDYLNNDEIAISRQFLLDSFLTIINDPKNNFTDKERRVIKLFLSGYSHKEIAKLTHHSLSAIYKFYNSAVNKIGKVMVQKK